MQPQGNRYGYQQHLDAPADKETSHPLTDFVEREFESNREQQQEHPDLSQVLDLVILIADQSEPTHTNHRPNDEITDNERDTEFAADRASDESRYENDA